MTREEQLIELVGEDHVTTDEEMRKDKERWYRGEVAIFGGPTEVSYLVATKKHKKPSPEEIEALQEKIGSVKHC